MAAGRRRGWLRLPKFLRLNRNTTRIWIVVAGLILQRWDPVLFAVGSALIVIGSCFRLWVKGYLMQRDTLTTSGPYAYVRHPFYLGNLILDIGIGLASGFPAVLLAYLPLWLFLHWRQMVKEEGKLFAAYGDSALEYQRDVPRLIPWRFWRPFRAATASAAGGGGGFSWSNPNFTFHGDIPRCITSMTHALLFYAAWQLRTYGTGVHEHFHTLKLLAVSAVPSLYAAADAIQWIQWHRRPLLPAWLITPQGRTVAYLVTLAATLSIGHPRMEFDAVVFPSGAAMSLVVLALLLAGGGRMGAVAQLALEGAGAVTTCWLAGVVWIAPFVAAFYATLAAGAAMTGRPSAEEHAPGRAAAWAPAVAFAAGTALLLLREYLIDGRLVLVPM